MNLETYSLLGTALYSISPIVEKVYLACVRLKDPVTNKVLFSGRDYFRVWKGSPEDVSAAMRVLDALGLVDNYNGSATGAKVSAKILPIENSWIYKFVSERMTHSFDYLSDLQTNADIHAYLNKCGVSMVRGRKTQGISNEIPDIPNDAGGISNEIPEKTAKILHAEAVIGTKNDLNCVQGISNEIPGIPKDVEVSHLRRDMMKKDMLLNNSLLMSETCVTTLSTTTGISNEIPQKKENMQRPQNVCKIWESWNDFTAKHKPFLNKTPMPHCMAVKNWDKEPSQNESNRALYENIAEWINANQNWEELWECFMDVAENNYWLQGRVGVKITLAFVFRLFDSEGHELPEGRVLDRAINGKYSQWDKKVNVNSNADGSLTEKGKQELMENNNISFSVEG